MTRVYVPGDSAVRALGSDAIANAVESHFDGQVEVVRNGSRGLYWLEPMIEVEAGGKRVAFGPVIDPGDVPALLDEGLPNTAHTLYLGEVDDIRALQQQNRITCARLGVVDPVSLDSYLQHGGYRGLEAALHLSPVNIVQAVIDSGLRGRGGAAFPAGIKWQTVANAEGNTKYIVCNADEGDSGTFVDRMLMEGDPFVLLEGMTIAALATGAEQGYIYLRSEYPQALSTLNTAIGIAMDKTYLGDNILKSGNRFHIEVRQAAGAYICGEETSMLESIEGKRGIVRYRPPLPAIQGLFGQPTVINNVTTLASVPAILAGGAAAYQQAGTGKSRGTLTVQLAGNVRHGGLYEVEFGISLRQVIEQWGGGTASGRPVRAAQVGGPLGAYIPASDFDIPLDYEAFAEYGAVLGHGGIVVFDDQTDMGEMAEFAMAFCELESCGKCTPCRVGSVRGKEVIQKIRRGESADSNRELLRDLCQTMVDGSLCAMGSMTPNAVLSVLEYFSEDL